MRALKIPKALSGHSGGKMFGRSKAEGGTEKKDEEGKERLVDEDAIHVVLAAGFVDSATSGCLLGRNGKDVQAAFWPRNHLNQWVNLGIARSGEQAGGEGCGGLSLG